MSTIKANAVTAVSTNADLSLDGLGTGGVSIASTLKMAKGGDISSASPLVIDTDGNYFDVTGTTNFAAMTVEAGNFFMLQFDGALTITHGSGIELPGAANLTTAAGDRLMCYATAANTVEVMSVETEAGASGSGLTLISNTDISDAATYDFTSFTAASYEHYVFYLQNLVPSTDAVHLWCRTSTDGGSSFDEGASDYTWGGQGPRHQEDVDLADGQFAITGDDTNAAATVGSTGVESGVSGVITLFGPHATTYTHIKAEIISHAGSPYWGFAIMGAMRLSAADVDGFRLLFSSGNIESGTITAYGVTNA
jgi:hypothetical protein